MLLLSVLLSVTVVSGGRVWTVPGISGRLEEYLIFFFRALENAMKLVFFYFHVVALTSKLSAVVLWSNFYPLSFFSVSRRVPWKNENAVYCLQISALVPEIFKFEKWVKYANEMTDDVIHSTQCYCVRQRTPS